jgi:hypothetical protein
LAQRPVPAQYEHLGSVDGAGGVAVGTVDICLVDGWFACKFYLSLALHQS